MDPVALSDAVIRFFEENRAGEFARNIKKEADRFSWKKMVEEIEELTGLDGCGNE